MKLSYTKPADRPDDPRIEFVATRTDSKDNVIDLYVISGEVDETALTQFCRDVQKSITPKCWHMIAFFTSKEVARFPSVGSYTSNYAVDSSSVTNAIKAEYMRHINHGSGTLNVYPESFNKGQHKVIVVD